MLADWHTRHDRNGFPLERATLGTFDLAVAFVGGEWQWLLRGDGRDLAEGAERAELAAQLAVEQAAVRLGAGRP